jgi:hypothetical protein
MRLSDLRRVAVKKQVRIGFPLSNGMQCVVDESGVSRVPGLTAAPEFNLEAELGNASKFSVEQTTVGARKENLDRAGLEALIAASGPAVQAHAAEE